MHTFSIIVPVYKTEKYLDKCVSSILQQSYTDFELILVDDGSPDNCPQMCDNYQKQDHRVRVLHKSNGGVSSARNLGMTVATGEYIWFVDSDDYIEPFSLQQLYEAQKEQKADMYVFNNGSIHGLSSNNINEFFEKYYFTYILGFEPWNKLYKRDMIQSQNLQFDTQETIGEDLLFNINYYKCIFKESRNSVFFLGKDYYRYTERVGSAMNTVSKGRINQQLRLFDKIQNRLSGILSEENVTYLFLMHLISGIGQSMQGGLTSKEFAQIDFEKYGCWFNNVDNVKLEFFKNENASQLGKLRIQLFLYLMKNKKYNLAGKLMGLK